MKSSMDINIELCGILITADVSETKLLDMEEDSRNTNGVQEKRNC